MVPSGYILAGKQPVSDRFVAIYYKEAVGTETDVTFSDSTDDLLVVASRYSKSGGIDTVKSAVGSATNATSVSVGPVSTAVDALCIAMFRKGGTAEVSQSFSDSFVLRSSAAGEQNNSSLVWVVDKIAASSSESVTHTLSAQTTRQSAVLVSFTESAPALPELRKGGTQTFDKPAGIGTITGSDRDWETEYG